VSLEDIWAKSPRHGRDTGESLTDHTLRTLTRLSELGKRYGEPPDAVAPELWNWLFWAATIHDFGKSASGFQAMLREGHPWGQRHEALSLAFVPWVADTEEDCSWIAGFVGTHHRDGTEILTSYRPDAPDEDTGIHRLVEEILPKTETALLGWLRDIAVPLAGSPVWAKRGVRVPEVLTEGESHPVSERDLRQALFLYQKLWQKCEGATPFDPRRQTALVGRGLMMLADHLASAHALALEPRPFSGDSDLLARAAVARWNKLQQRALTCEEPVRLLAPTGSGKTEWAVRWAVRRSWCRGSLVYLLPYQASLNAMRLRLRSLLGSEVGLIHGHSVQALYQEAKPSLGPADAEQSARRDDDLARLYRPPAWLTTPYHLLRAAYGLPGHATTWAALQGGALVVDEVHAYEPTRLGMILGLLETLQDRCGSRLLVMTATTPAWVADLLDSQLGLKLCRGGYRTNPRIRLRVADRDIEDEAVLRRVLDAAESGKKVLVCVNTVGTAVATAEALRRLASHIETCVLHSRFHAKDRIRHEQAVLRRVGATSDSQAEAHGTIVVATQVIEVSLDLDFDEGYVEFAPPDALVQRMGRINRKGLRDPSTVVLLCGRETMRRARRVYGGRRAGDPPQESLPEETVLDRGRAVAQELDGRCLTDADLETWVECGYADVGPAYRKKALRARTEFRSGCLAHLNGWDGERESNFEGLFGGTEVLPAGLEREFDLSVKTSVLEAMQLLVPVPDWALAHWPCRRRQDPRILVMDAPYDPERGLVLSAARG